MNEVNPGAQPQANAGAVPTMERTKFCKHCGQKIPEDAVICTQCGRQVEELRQAAPVQAQPQIIINNDNTNTNTNTNNYIISGKLFHLLRYKRFCKAYRVGSIVCRNFTL